MIRLLRPISSFVLSLCASISLIYQVTPSLTLNKTHLLWAIILLISFFYFFSHKIIHKLFKSYSNQTFWHFFIASLILSILFVCMMPVSIQSQQKLTIDALGTKSAISKSSEVWVKEIQVDGKSISIDNLKINGDWEIKNGVPVSYRNQPNELVWNGPIKSQIAITFARHPYSGYVKVSLNGKVYDYDLYSSTEFLRTEVITPVPDISSYLLIFITNVICFFSLFLLLLNTIYKFNLANSNYSTNFLYYILPLFVFTIYFVSFYPALMSGDSIDQWRQINTLELYDAHPVFHTLLVWLLTRIWNSPAIIAIFQIIFFSFILGYGWNKLKQIGVSDKILIPLMIIFTLLPMNGMIAISLWKDVPYSISLLWLTFLTIVIFKSDGEWISKRQNQIHLGIVLLLVLMFRHNGFISFFGLSAAVLLLYRKYWRKFVLVVATTFIVFLVIKYPIYQYLHVSSSPKVLALSLPLQQVGSYMKHGVQVSEKDLDVINKILPLDSWGKNYNPYLIDTLIYNKDFHILIFDDYPDLTSQFIKVWGKLTLQHPVLAIHAWLSQISIIWSMNEPNPGVTYTVEEGIAKTGVEMLDKYQLKTETPIPEMRNRIISVVDFTKQPIFIGILWRPAIFIFISIFFGFIMAYRNGWKSWLILTPAMFNVIGLMASIPAQQVRYAYSSIIVSFVIVAISFIKMERNTL